MKKTFREKISFLIATGLGLGYVPKAPGTAGALLGILIGLLVNFLPLILGLFFLIFLVLLGCYVSTRVEERLGGKDPQIVVIDEIAGMAISLWLIPISFSSVLIQFLLFRAFDIYKPFPVKQMETIFKRGAGIMMDDVMAGVIVNLLFRFGSLFLS